MSKGDPTPPAAGFMDGPMLLDALPSIGVLMASGAIETWVLTAAISGELPWWELGSVHILVIVCLAVRTYARWHRGKDVRLSVLGVLGVGGCGPMGAAGACIAFFMHAAAQRNGRDSVLNADPTSVDVAPRADANALVRRILSTPHESRRGSVTSFNDVMTLGTVEEKRAAISLIVARFCPEFTQALKRGLRDQDAAVRVQAATAVSRLENLFQRRVGELESAAQSGGSAERLQLAHCLDEVSGTGLLDASRTVSWRERALKLYQGIANEQGVSSERLAEVALPIARALVRLGREREACAWLERLPASLPMTAQLLLWRLEAVYRAGDYTQLRSLCRQHRTLLRHDTPAPPAVLAAVGLWGEYA